jgi:predicted metal-dependent hydrolase
MTYGGLAISLARDPIARRHPILLARQARALFRGPVFRGLLRELAGYMKPGFHPNDVDTQALLEEWQVKLFGTDGALVDRVK